MIIALFWSIMNLFYYTSSVGLSAEIRSELSETIFQAERSRLLFDQERKYALDRALLFTGLIGGNASDDCGSMLVTESFPFLPVPFLYNEEPIIRYWKNHGAECIPED